MDLLSNSNSLWSHRRTLSPKGSPPSLAIDLFASLLFPRGGEHSRIGKEKRNQPPALLLIPCLLFAVCGRRVVAKKVIVIGLASNAVAVIYWNRFFTPAGLWGPEGIWSWARRGTRKGVPQWEQFVCWATTNWGLFCYEDWSQEMGQRMRRGNSDLNAWGEVWGEERDNWLGGVNWEWKRKKSWWQN